MEQQYLYWLHQEIARLSAAIGASGHQNYKEYLSTPLRSGVPILWLLLHLVSGPSYPFITIYFQSIR